MPERCERTLAEKVRFLKSKGRTVRRSMVDAKPWPTKEASGVLWITMEPSNSAGNWSNSTPRLSPVEA